MLKQSIMQQWRQFHDTRAICCFLNFGRTDIAADRRWSIRLRKAENVIRLNIGLFQVSRFYPLIIYHTL